MPRLRITGLNPISKKSNKMKKRGITLTELTVALGLFALLAIPAYMVFSYGAADEMSYHKTAAANRILESCRDEIKNLSYKYAEKDLVPSFTNVNSPPSTFNTFMDFQKDFKDKNFKLEGKAVVNKNPDHIKFDLKVTWTKKNGSIAEETLSFIKVK
jgi:type II secretory pathway pseudopilin PulG